MYLKEGTVPYEPPPRRPLTGPTITQTPSDVQSRRAPALINTVAHIQGAQCTALKKIVTGAHNECWEYLLGAITNFGKLERKFVFIGDDKDRQLESLWKDTEIGNVLPWEDIEDEAERLLELRRASQDATTKDNENGEQKCDREVMRDGADSYEEVIFGRRRPDSVVVDWANRVLFVLEFKCTSDQRRDYREHDQRPNTTFLSKVSRKWPETQMMKMKVGRLSC